MPQILILADDMTGANDTGCAIHDLGIDVCCVNDLSLPAPLAEHCPCISVNLDSRALPPRDAARTVVRAVSWNQGDGPRCFSARLLYHNSAPM